MTAATWADTSELDEFLSRLDGLRQHNDYWTARCPAHDDREPSLSISRGDDRPIVLTCHAGCSFEEVYKAVMGRPPRLRPQSETAYRYVDESDTPLFEVVRGPGKSFYQRRVDPITGETSPGLGDVRKVIYRLPEVLEAVRRGETIFVVEGEKDADRLAREGLVATTNPGGAGKWRSAYSAPFAGGKVVIIPDNDEPGRRHAQQVHDSLQEVAEAVEILELPDLPSKGDVSDWLDNGGTAKELMRLAVQALAPGGLRLLTLEELSEMPAPSCLIDSFLVADGLNLFYGPSGGGKTFVTLDMACSLASGTPWQGYETQLCRVVYIVGEGTRGLYQRIAAWSEIHAPVPSDHPRFVDRAVNLLRDKEVDHLIRLLRPFRPRLVILDPLARFMPGADENSPKDMGKAIASLGRIMSEVESGLLVIHHTGKDKTRKERGDSALRAAADMALQLNTRSGVVHVQVDKARDLPGGKGVHLRLEPVSGSAVPQPTKKPSASDDAKLATLKALASFGDGGATNTDWQTRAKRDAGTSDATFQRYLRDLVEQGLVTGGGGRGVRYTLTPAGRGLIESHESMP